VWRALVFVAVFAACDHGDRAPEDAWARCRAVLKKPIKDLGPVEGVEACRDLFRPDCRDAMKLAVAGMDLDDGVAIVKRCAAAYCPISGQPLCVAAPTARDARDGGRALLSAALGKVPGIDKDDRHGAALMLESELLRSHEAVARLTASPDGVRIALDGGDAWSVPLHATAADFAPFIAGARLAGADAFGLLIWGSDDAPDDVQRALFRALGAVHLESIACARDGRNCR
jgi:hypothetical protein